MPALESSPTQGVGTNAVRTRKNDAKAAVVPGVFEDAVGIGLLGAYHSSVWFAFVVPGSSVKLTPAILARYGPACVIVPIRADGVGDTALCLDLLLR